MSTNKSIPETKSYGVVEAAQDPNITISSRDIEEKIVEESRRAGVLAFSFDPEASPREKAAQAKALTPEGFHRKHQPVATAIVTDLEDPNLPSIASSLSAKTSDFVTPVNGDNVKQPVNEENQSFEKDEEARWTERVGWAPRFGNPTLSINEENLADHQTWVETKLDDKYFGDWYHNTGIIIFACLASWLAAVLGGGLAWLLLILAICGTYYRTSIRRVRRNFRDDISREIAMRKLETDTESLEWINSFLVKFWPIFQPVFAETMINSVDQILSTSTPAFLDSLRLKTFTLGSKPPRMEHVKTYPKAEDDIVLMDWKFSFNPMDRTDMTSAQIKNQVNPKVVLEIRVGKAIISKGLDVIVEDMAFSGLMRIKFKLQIPFPHVEKIEVSFLEKPLIDYVCKPLGGETLGFDINFIPGLESFILDQIHANIGPMFYAPNVFPIEVAQILSGTPVDQAVGVLAVTLHGAQGLKNPDKFAGLPDPYVKLSFNNGATLAQTKVVKENPNPKWNESKYLIITSFIDSLTLHLYDYNEIRKDRELGMAKFSLDSIQETLSFQNEQLEIIYNGKACGILSADIVFFPVLEGRDLPDGSKEPPPESNTGIARFTVEQAKDLDGTKSLIGLLNPYAVLLLNGKEIHISRKLKRTNNPIWDNGSKEILITDRKNAKLGLIIKDDRDLSTDPILGTYQIKLDEMLLLMEKGHEWYNLNNAKTGRAKLKLQWKPVALTGISSGSGGYVTPIGVMRFHFKDARKLRNAETLGKSDPYARVLLSGIEKGRTVTFGGNLNPDWDEVIYVPVHSTREKVTLEVMDEEKLGSDRSLGYVELSTADYISQTDNSEYMVREPVSYTVQLHTHKKEPSRGTLNYTVGFYPCLNVADPDDADDEVSKILHEKSRNSTGSIKAEDVNCMTKSISDQVENENIENSVITAPSEKEKKTPKSPAKIRLTAEELLNYESGLIIFKIMNVDIFKTNVHIEFLVDDMIFPSYTSSLIKSHKSSLNEIGDCIVRELEFSRITIRIREKGKSQSSDKKDKDQTIARLTTNSFSILKQCLNNPTTLLLRNDDGEVCSIKISMKYLPLNMKVDPNESFRNMGKLRVDVLDASDLPSADRNGYSDAFCKFELNGKEIYKTKVIKKSLNPVWNEFFEVDIPSRTTAQLNCIVYDWDFGEKNDLLGSTMIDLKQLDIPKALETRLKLNGKSGSVRFRLLFRPDYITRSSQRSTSLAGTLGSPGRIVTGVAGVPLKGVGIAAQGVSKGASFLKGGLKSKKRDDDEFNFSELAESEVSNKGDLDFDGGSRRKGTQTAVSSPLSQTHTPHSRTKSLSASSAYGSGMAGAGPSSGTASFTILSASGYPASTNLIVHVKQLFPKPKTLHKTEHIKSATGNVIFDEKKESFKWHCAADTQFQIQVKDHRTFGSDDDLGEGLFFLDDSGSEIEKPVKIGNGFVTIRSNFIPYPEVVESSPRSSSSGFRKSILGKRENAKGNLEVPSNTPPR